jgi:hypothetical protein
LILKFLPTEYPLIKKILTHINFESQQPETLAHSPPLFKDTVYVPFLRQKSPSGSSLSGSGLRLSLGQHRFFAPRRLSPALVMVQGAQARQLSIDLNISKAFAAPLLTLQRKANYYTYTLSGTKTMARWSMPKRVYRHLLGIRIRGGDDKVAHGGHN